MICQFTQLILLHSLLQEVKQCETPVNNVKHQKQCESETPGNSVRRFWFPAVAKIIRKCLHFTSCQAGNVVLSPHLLGGHQKFIKEKINSPLDKPAFLVMHGGSGSTQVRTYLYQCTTAVSSIVQVGSEKVSHFYIKKLVFS